MDETISVSEARRKFSQLLRYVREGRRCILTSRGQPVAQLIPVDGNTGAKAGALAALLARLQSQPLVYAERWERDELYSDEL